MERIDSNGHLPYISIPHTNTDNCFAETLPSTKQVREGTNHSLTAEKAESEQPQTKDKLHDEEPLALPKSELIDNEANVTSQTIRERIETPNLTYRYGFINEEGSQ